MANPEIDRVLYKLGNLGVTLPDAPVHLGTYGDSPEMCEELLDLIRHGRKRAGTSLLWLMEAEMEPIPLVGDIEVALDFSNEPALVTQLVSVDVVPFMAVSAEYAAIEGEGDGSLEYWRKVHWDFFSRDCKSIGRKPAETMPLVCSVFEVLNVLPSAST